MVGFLEVGGGGVIAVCNKKGMCRYRVLGEEKGAGEVVVWGNQDARAAALERCLKDPVEDVRTQARQALGAIRWPVGTLIVVLAVVLAVGVAIGLLLKERGSKLVNDTGQSRWKAAQVSDTANLQWHFRALTLFKNEYGALPSQSDHKFILAPWVRGVVERTEQNMERYFHVEHKELDYTRDLLAEDPEKVWRNFEDLTVKGRKLPLTPYSLSGWKSFRSS